MRTANRVFGWLLVLACCGHTLGTLKGYPAMSPIWVWSLGSSLAGLLLGGVSLIASGRPTDRALSGLTLAGSVGWIFVALAFGVSIGQVLDPRVVGHAVIAAGLAVSSGVALCRRPAVADEIPRRGPLGSLELRSAR